MSIDPTNGVSLARELADLKRRLNLLERSGAHVSSMAVSGPDPEETIVEMGGLRTQSDVANKDSLELDGSQGLAVYDYVGTERVPRMRVSDVKGVELPKTHTSWISGVSHPSVGITAGSYTSAWVAYMIGGPDSDSLSTEFFISAPVGTTAKMKVDNLATGLSTDEMTHTGTGSSTTRKVRWLHGIPLEDITGATWVFRLRVYRSAGAGTITVWQPTALMQGDLIGTTSGGVFQ